MFGRCIFWDWGLRRRASLGLGFRGMPYSAVRLSYPRCPIWFANQYTYANTKSERYSTKKPALKIRLLYSYSTGSGMCPLHCRRMYDYGY